MEMGEHWNQLVWKDWQSLEWDCPVWMTVLGARKKSAQKCAKKTAKKWRWFWKLMNAENIAKRKKKPKHSGAANIMNWNVCQSHAFRIQCLACERQEQTKRGFSFPPGGMFDYRGFSCSVPSSQGRVGLSVAWNSSHAWILLVHIPALLRQAKTARTSLGQELRTTCWWILFVAVHTSYPISTSKACHLSNACFVSAATINWLGL